MKKIIIIGASSGIGKSLADLYISRGACVGLAARRVDVLREMSQNHTDVHFTECDVQVPEESIGRLQLLAEKMGGNIDLIMVCSGIGQMNPQLETSIEQETIRTNVVGWTAVVDWAFAYFKQQSYGHLAAISSIASLRGLGPAPSYSATKAYQAHYLESLHQCALARYNKIFVTNIRPGFVSTPMLAHPEKFFWVVPVDKVARQIVRAIEKRKSVVTVSRRWKFLVPVILLLPNIIISKLIRRVL